MIFITFKSLGHRGGTIGAFVNLMAIEIVNNLCNKSTIEICAFLFARFINNGLYFFQVENSIPNPLAELI